MGCGKLEIDSAIFQDLESFGKEKFFEMAMETFWIFVWKYSNISKNGYNTVPF